MNSDKKIMTREMFDNRLNELLSELEHSRSNPVSAMRVRKKILALTEVYMNYVESPEAMEMLS